MEYVLNDSKLKELPAKFFDELLFYGLLKLNKENELILNSTFFTQRNINNVTESEEHGPGNNIYVEVIEFLNREAKTRYKPNVQATRRLINARIQEGFTLDDFKTVIQTKCKEWGKDPQMKKYIRPTTLFAASKFESYLNQAEPLKPKEQPKQPQAMGNDGYILYDVNMDW